MTNRINRAAEEVWKLLSDICVLRAVKDDMMLIFNRISNLLIGVKAVEVLIWEARIVCGRPEIWQTQSANSGCNGHVWLALAPEGLNQVMVYLV